MNLRVCVTGSIAVTGMHHLHCAALTLSVSSYITGYDMHFTVYCMQECEALAAFKTGPEDGSGKWQ
jgi:hypothetical protein